MCCFAFLLAALGAGRLFAAPGPAAPVVVQPAAPLPGQFLRPTQPYRLAPPAMRENGQGFDRAPSLPQASSIVPLLIALPASAGYGNSGGGSSDGGGIFDLILNGFLTVVVLGLAGFILKYAFDAAAEVASQTGERAERLGFGQQSEQPQSNEPLYDDTDYKYKNLSEKVENSRTRKQQSKQFKADGTRLAPWMVIDEDAIAKNKAARAAQKQKEKQPEKKKGGSFLDNFLEK